jgi:3-deoxy-manno-octulosonate cytidylyltransferase (CMP-KDO synthetase)
MKAKVLAVIPARLHSRRFPNKVLYPYHGMPLLYYVWKEVCSASMINRLVIATDSREIERKATGFGAEVFRTSVSHKTGSDRAAEVAESLDGDIILNIQADNFGLRHAVLGRVIKQMKSDRSIEVATLARRIESDEELFDPNLVKVITSKNGQALWFSRYPLPYLQRVDNRPRVEQHKFYGHVGVYFFRRAALRLFAEIGRGPFEKAESLEQLRILENGSTMRVFHTTMRSISVDSPGDVKKLASIYN